MKRMLPLIVCLGLLVGAVVHAETLNNASVIQLHKVGLGDPVIVEKIKASTCQFDISVDALKNLKEAGLSDAVIQAMIVFGANLPKPAEVDQGVATMGSGTNGLPQQQQVKDYVFELQECRADGDQLVCELKVTNKLADRQLTIWGYQLPPTSVIDNLGYEYTASGGALGHVGGSQWTPNVPGYSGVQDRLPSGVGVKARLFFPNFSRKASSIAILGITCDDENRKRIQVQFRNVPVSRVPISKE